jgi:hypothetical protein
MEANYGNKARKFGCFDLAALKECILKSTVVFVPQRWNSNQRVKTILHPLLEQDRQISAEFDQKHGFDLISSIIRPSD